MINDSLHWNDFTCMLEMIGEKTGFGERVDTFFSPRMWHHAGRPTTGHPKSPRKVVQCITVMTQITILNANLEVTMVFARFDLIKCKSFISFHKL